MDAPDQPTLEAARITAAATVHAAWIQGTAAATAVLGAIVAGIFAYKGATRQVRLHEDQAKARTEAYRFKVSIIVDELYTAAAVDASEAQFQLNRYRAAGPPENLTAMPFSIPDELTPTNWADHAMLGIVAVRGIHRLYECLRTAILFNMEMRGKLWSEVSSEPTFARTEPMADGGLRLIADVAVEQHVKLAEDLFGAIKSLQGVFAIRPERGSNMERKEGYDIAVRMFMREHDRWVQNALFLFGAPASVFLAAKELKQIVPLSVALGFATLVSILSVFIALSIRGSTDSWKETILQIERSTGEGAQPFEWFRAHHDHHSHRLDLLRALRIWRRDVIFSVTRIYMLLGILSGIIFASLTYRAIMGSLTW